MGLAGEACDIGRRLGGSRATAAASCSKAAALRTMGPPPARVLTSLDWQGSARRQKVALGADPLGEGLHVHCVRACVCIYVYACILCYVCICIYVCIYISAFMCLCMAGVIMLRAVGSDE